MTDNLPTNQETGDLLLYQTEDGLTRVEVHFEKRMKKLEQIESNVSKAKLSKKRKEGE
jgi:hypothetical protein